ncbi:helix-turn-helix domain-containing protein [Thiocystis violascens]|uniref:Transposase n=1 Tax=Thiocystis violascens (strain ATCC 17096 / DSM 198 / 6111) TaxID=765911 RepID=I3Y5T1_THIV6|nr:helix-turn-helix domain-containing protein [Thiocystis violascens]AFL72349.1 hypothetical protein Thivi_0280 [Thiocystis violascens DSM 198]AFL72352.1 hypothetical protein Thivi_0283 [Thiocystis violascens DSM 198]
MKEPLFIRPLSAEERQTLEAGLCASDSFIRRRCQILLSNADGHTAPKLSVMLGCASETARSALRAFAVEGLECLNAKSRRPKNLHRPLLEGEQAEQLRALLHFHPREFGKSANLWTLSLIAEVAFERGLTGRLLCIEAIRQVLKRLGVDWKQAKHWSANPFLRDARREAPQSAVRAGGDNAGIPAVAWRV